VALKNIKIHIIFSILLISLKKIIIVSLVIGYFVTGHMLLLMILLQIR